MSRYRNLLLLLFLTTSCSSAYYGAMEKLGYHKRDLMISRVKAAKDSQQEAKAQFRDALEQFHSVLGAKGGKLQEQYDKLSVELATSEAAADKVRSRIGAVEDVSKALFREWKSELSGYTNKTLRSQSEQRLSKTERRYGELIGAMKRAESKLEPALQPLRDDVLFLKHNLNAQAIGSLDDELRSVESNVDGLVRDLERSIAEADRFVAELNQEG